MPSKKISKPRKQIKRKYQIKQIPMQGNGLADTLDDLKYNIKSKIFDIKSYLRRNKPISNALYAIAEKTGTSNRLAEIADHYGYGKIKKLTK